MTDYEKIAREEIGEALDCLEKEFGNHRYIISGRRIRDVLRLELGVRVLGEISGEFKERYEKMKERIMMGGIYEALRERYSGLNYAQEFVQALTQ